MLLYRLLRKGASLHKYIADELGNAEFIGDFEPDTPDWHQLRLQGVGGSEIGTILGLNPYESAYTLWHKKKGLIDDGISDDNMAIFIGKSMETPILERYASKHPELEIWVTGTWRNKEHGWMHANPDAIYCHRETGEWGIIEIKTGRNPWLELPPGYKAQVQWYLQVFGWTQGRIIGIAGYQWEEHLVELGEFEAGVHRAAGKRFMDFVHSDTKPDWDGSQSTYETVRRSHAEIEDSEVEVGELGLALWQAQKHADEAQAELNKAKSITLDAMGRAKHAVMTVDGEGTFRVASRQARRDGVPYLVVKK